MLQLILDKLSTLDKKIESVHREMKLGFEKVNKRLDAQGKTLSYLEDDSPTRDEHDHL